MSDFNLFTKKNPDHMLNDDYLATQRAKRNKSLGRCLGCFLALIATRYLWK